MHIYIYILNKIAIVLLDFWAKVHAIKPGVMLLLANQKALIRVIEIYRFFCDGSQQSFGDIRAILGLGVQGSGTCRLDIYNKHRLVSYEKYLPGLFGVSGDSGLMNSISRAVWFWCFRVSGPRGLGSKGLSRM